MGVISRTGVELHRYVAAALLVLTAGCGTTPAQPAPAPVPVETPTVPATTPTATPQQPRVGGTQTSADAESSMDVTVLRLRVPFTPVVPDVLDRKGYIYAGAEVKACVTRNVGKLPIGVSWGPWSLSYASGVVVEAASSYGDWWDEPLYPQEHIVAVGRCVRGWIPFEVRSKDGRPERVTYAPSSGGSLEWTVSAS